MSKYREQRDRLNERVAMASKLGDQMHSSTPNSLEHLLLARVLEVFVAANSHMHEKLEQQKEIGEDKTVYPENHPT